MAAVTIYSDFGAPKIKSYTVSTVSPSISHEVMGLDAKVIKMWNKGQDIKRNTGKQLLTFPKHHTHSKLKKTNPVVKLFKPLSENLQLSLLWEMADQFI